MRFKCIITKADFKQYGCTEVIVIDNVLEIIFKECGDCPMMEIKYCNSDGHLCYKIMPTRGINCIDMEGDHYA